jgi:hypothetical protein
LTSYILSYRSLLIRRGGVRTKLDRLCGELLSELIDLAKEAVLASGVGLGVPFFLVAIIVSVWYLSL